MAEQVFWSSEDLAARYGKSVRTLIRWRDSSKYSRPFPEPALNAGMSSSLWRVEHVLAWEAAGGLTKRGHG